MRIKGKWVLVKYCETGDELLLLTGASDGTVADCTGHGAPGAFMSMLGITLLNEIRVRKGGLFYRYSDGYEQGG